MGPGERRRVQPGDALEESAAGVQSLEDLGELLRALRRRHARANRGSILTYQELAERTGWSRAAIAEYFTARTLPPTDKYDALLQLLGAAPEELRALAKARDRVEENERHARQARAKSAAPDTGVGQKQALGAQPLARAAMRQLPADTGLFVGRANELEVLLALAEQTQVTDGEPGVVLILAIDGMGGVGKTALAVHAAHRLTDRFPDGQLFLDLHGFAEDRPPRETGDALATLLAAMGVAPGRIPAQVDARAALYRDRLAGTRTLIILDNAFDENQVRALLPASPGCLVMITSRRRLKALDDAVPLPLGMLERQQAAALLRRAARASPDCVADARWDQVAQLCGCLPLALLIAGALLRVGGRAWNLDRLIDRLAPYEPRDELTGYTDEARSLSAVFDISLRVLPEGEQRLFRRIGLSPATEIDVYAAAALLDADPDDAERHLERLTDHSLLIGSSRRRYRIHDLLHRHARALVEADCDGENDDAVGRLLEFYQHTASQASMHIALSPRRASAGPGPTHQPAIDSASVALAWLRTERAGLEAVFELAVARGLDAQVAKLGSAMAELLRYDGPWSRARDVHTASADAARRRGDALAQADALTDLGRQLQLLGQYSDAVDALDSALNLFTVLDDAPGRANALAELGRTHRLMGQPAADALDQALSLYGSVGDLLGQADVLSNIGHVRRAAGDRPGAAKAFEQALERYRTLGHQACEANALTYLGGVQLATGDRPAALDVLERALMLHRTNGSLLGQANTLQLLGQARYMTGDYPKAEENLEQALDLHRTLGNRLGEANVLQILGAIRRDTADYAGAATLFDHALELFDRLGEPQGKATTLTNLGILRSSTGMHAQAAALFTKALEICRAIGNRGNEGWALNQYAAVLAHTDVEQALPVYRDALQVNQEVNQPQDAAVALEGIANCLLRQGQTDAATTHLTQALEIYHRLGATPDAHRVQDRLHSLKTQNPHR